MTQAPVTPTPLPGPVDPAATVLPPAIGLIAFGIFGALLALLMLLLNLLGVGLGAADGSQEGISLAVQGTLGIVQNIIGIAIAGLVVFAGLKMKKLETFPLVILFKPEVKAAFKS